jgi:hypothetical protein
MHDLHTHCSAPQMQDAVTAFGRKRVGPTENLDALEINQEYQGKLQSSRISDVHECRESSPF